MEYYEFFALDTNAQYISVYKEVEKQIPMNFFERCIKKILPRYMPRILRMIDIEKLVVSVLDNKFTAYESIFNEVNKKDSKKKKGDSGLFSASLSIVCQKYCISVMEAMEKLTLEQFMWLQDGIIYNLNIQDKE